jgi:hypothetical protein
MGGDGFGPSATGWPTWMARGESSSGISYEGTDEELLDEIQRASFRFFWNETDQRTGQIKDRAL